jgi:predicted GIY-YIG superfamily endonuclease
MTDNAAHKEGHPGEEARVFEGVHAAVEDGRALPAGQDSGVPVATSEGKIEADWHQHPLVSTEQIAGVGGRRAGPAVGDRLHYNDAPPGHEQWFIYLLRDPLTDEPRYVGSTQFPARRLWRHVNERSNLGSVWRSMTWIAGLAAVGQYPVMEIIGTAATRTEAIHEEWRHIRSGRWQLLNGQDVYRGRPKRSVSS